MDPGEQDKERSRAEWFVDTDPDVHATSSKPEEQARKSLYVTSSEKYVRE